jgi:hypothetical protein
MRWWSNLRERLRGNREAEQAPPEFPDPQEEAVALRQEFREEHKRKRDSERDEGAGTT